VLTNSTATFTDGAAIVSGRDKNQVAGLELNDTVRASGADDTYQEYCCVLPPHGADRGGVGQVQYTDHRGRVLHVGVGAEHLAGQVNCDAAGDYLPSKGGDI
jgi:hypothetical protein